MRSSNGEHVQSVSRLEHEETHVWAWLNVGRIITSHVCLPQRAYLLIAFMPRSWLPGLSAHCAGHCQMAGFL